MSLTLASISATTEMVSGPCVVFDFHLAGGSDAATAVVRDGGATGPIRVKLAAPIGDNDSLSNAKGYRFTKNVHVTITGTSPVFSLSIDNPQANQLNPS